MNQKLQFSKNAIFNQKYNDQELLKLAVKNSTEVIVANEQSFLLFTAGKILQLDTKLRLDVIFEESEDVEMGRVKPVHGQDCAYFVQIDVAS